MSSKTLLAAAVAAVISYAGTGLASADIINITPSKDNTLYQYDPADGDTSNALGFHLFAGKTGMGELRRGVLAFDIAGSIPAGSTITGVTLSMNMSRTPISVAYPVELHKLLADWGEGTSQASGEEGDGAPATPNDATWRHRFFDTIFWAAEGGDFSATVSASQSVSVVGPYTWSSQQMVADVQDWLDNPAGNFGWLVLGIEKPTLTVKRFDTRESANPPVLTIEYASSSRASAPTKVASDPATATLEADNADRETGGFATQCLSPSRSKLIKKLRDQSALDESGPPTSLAPLLPTESFLSDPSQGLIADDF